MLLCHIVLNLHIIFIFHLFYEDFMMFVCLLSCYPAPLVLQIILISVKLNEGTDSDILMFFTAECLNRYLLVLSYQSYKNSGYLPDQSLTPAIITIRCTTTSLNREMLHQRYSYIIRIHVLQHHFMNKI